MQDGSTKTRICVDFRDLNSVANIDAMALPNLKDIIFRLHRVTLFAMLKLASKYHEVKITHEYKEKKGFSKPWARYHCNNIPFSLSKVHST